MPVNLSIKNVPDELASRLRARASRNHRSLQGELMAILEESTAENEAMTPMEILQEVRKLGLRTADEAADMIRRERDER